MKHIEPEQQVPQRDHLSPIVEAWHRERPELRTFPMEVLGRIGQIALLADREMRRSISSLGLTSGTFNVLASLRRAGGDYCLNPSDLMNTLWVTSGAVSKRVDRLERMGLVTRTQHPSDRRAITVCLTEEGREVIDQAVDRHVQNGASILSTVYTDDEVDQLIGLLSKLLGSMEERMTVLPDLSLAETDDSA